MQGIFAINKPKGPTSHDIIDQLRKITGIKKIGHAGTLDPLASGVLVVGIGREATKKLGEVVKKEKEYLAMVRMGEESTTDDAEGEKRKFGVTEVPTLENIKKIIEKFQGEIMQTPPVYSAVKIKGRPAHRRVRKGEKIELAPRKVVIREIEIIKYKWPNLKLRVVTGPGVYIRSLARDIGKELGVGGYLAELERTRVGEFRINEAVSVESFGG
jgi:tRNA pseudouridine55 synthase